MKLTSKANTNVNGTRAKGGDGHAAPLPTGVGVALSIDNFNIVHDDENPSATFFAYLAAHTFNDAFFTCIFILFTHTRSDGHVAVKFVFQSFSAVACPALSSSASNTTTAFVNPGSFNLLTGMEFLMAWLKRMAMESPI
jgi:hypothetical protein